MESHIWNNFVNSEFMGIEQDYLFETVIGKSGGNDQALISEAVPSAVRQEADVDSVASDEASREDGPTTDSPGDDSMSLSELAQETKMPHQNVIFLTNNSLQDTLKTKHSSGKSYPLALKKLNGVGCKRKRETDKLLNHSSEIPKVIQSTAFVPRENAKQSLPNWDELKNPFRYEKPVELLIDNINYYVNYVKLVTDGSGTIYFKLLNNPNVSAKKKAALTLKFNKVLWYYCAYTEIKISQQLEWNWHLNFQDSSSLFLVLPKLK